MLLRIYIIVTVWLSFSSIYGQKFTISGYVKDNATGEDLIGANIYIKGSGIGTTTNSYGFYSLTLAKGEYTLVSSFLGYDNFETHLLVDKSIKLNISLNVAVIAKNEVVIIGDKEENIQSTEMGTVKMPVEKIKSLPSFMGEVDVLKAIQFLPGVQSAGEGNSGFYVRGGGPDQNLILLDEATVYNASHLFGFFSIFNSDAVKNINLVKGGMPANYGGRLSSVLDVSMNDGNMKQYVVNAGIGLIASHLTIQGPILKDTCSFLVSGRRTYVDVIADPFISETAKAKGSGYYFYDLNGKANYRFSDKDRLYLSGYYGRDVFTYKNKKSSFNARIPWGNATAAIRWNHLFNDKLFVNTSFIFSNYDFEFEAGESDFKLNMYSSITDYNLKSDITWFPTIRHNLKFGINYIYHNFVPSYASATINNTDYNTGSKIEHRANDGAIYINDDFDVTEKLKVSVGLRGTIFQPVGPFTRYVKNDYKKTVDTVYYKSGEQIALYKHLEPRFSARYTLHRNSSVKASYTQNYQYIHMATISSVSLPTDLWIPCSELVKPQYGTQLSLGYFQNFSKNYYETSVEVYYKKLENLVEYEDGALPLNNFADNADNFLTFGNGESYGIELFFKKVYGKTTGWVGYTLSKTERTFPEINNGVPFPAKYDRRHDLSIILSHDLKKKWTISAAFVYATGTAMTLPVGRYYIDGRIVNEYGARNSYRMKPYHRMDLSITYLHKKTDKWESSWNFSIYNVYNRYNAYFIYFTYEGNMQDMTFQTRAYEVSLFSILPSLTWNFRF